LVTVDSVMFQSDKAPINIQDRLYSTHAKSVRQVHVNVNHVYSVPMDIEHEK